MLKVYFISGMGADRRIFRHIRLPANFEADYLDWIPFKKGEELEDYAVRLAEGIAPGEPFILIGLSLGGIMAVEIAKRRVPVCTILLSSVPLSGQLPSYFKIARWLPLLDLVPLSFFKSSAILKRMFTLESKEDKALILQMIREADASFIRWAMGAVVGWRNKVMPVPLWHLHGTRDEIFPIWLTRPTHRISGGGHLLVLTHAREVNTLLGEILPI